MCVPSPSSSLTLSHSHIPHTHTHTHTHTPHTQDALTLQKTAKDANKRLQQGWSSTPPPTPPTKPTPRGRPKGRTGSTSTQVGDTPGAVQTVARAQISPVEALLTAVKNCIVRYLLCRLHFLTSGYHHFQAFSVSGQHNFMIWI